MVHLAGYTINAQLYESANSQVYRGLRQADKRPVVLKVLKEAYPPPERIAWFKREYEVTRSLNLPGVIDAYDLETIQNRWVMALEDFGGDSLALLQVAGRLNLADFLTLAIAVADTLGQIHRQHIIHKDVNPSNIVFNPATGQVKLIDFGISTVLSQETPTFDIPNVLEGTLAYISPEQTGRMNRVMDYRTDLYSLGATFYELLAGQVPFPSADPLEVLHGHIAKQPPVPRALNPAIPPPISEIVLKLLAKNAEDRYQSAYGLKADLEECLRQWSAVGRVDPFPLARHDVSEQFQLPQKLYGREVEIERLLAAFERVSQGACEMMLVAGYAGIGKTALVQEIYRPITRQRGYYVAGKFDQLQRNIPYSALIQAFRALVRLLLMESEAQIAAWREQVLAALGPNGRVVIDVIPEVELILGPQPDTPSLAPAEAQNRFSLTFQNFIGVFARPEHPLVIFLDDLQWADGASLKLLQSFMTGAVSRSLFLIGAYRDAEVSATHPLSLTLKEMRQTGAVVNDIALAPLNLSDVTRFVADTLRCAPEPDEVEPLAQLVLSKTGGNPFFIGEFLKSLHAEGLIAFDHARGRCRWDIERIQTLGVTDNVVDLMAGKIQQLEPSTRRALQLAACVGHRFDLETLAIVHQKSPQATALDLRAALVAGLVLPLSDAYQLMELEVAGLADEVLAEYRFAHDRIQQAAYSLIPEADRPAIHWQIGQLLWQHTLPNERERRVFDLVNQLNQGRTISADQSARDELAELNLLAGKRAKSSVAYQPTYDYLQVGLALLGDNAWQRRYDLTLELAVETAEAAYLAGDFEGMERLADMVLPQAKTLLDTVKIYEIKIEAYMAQNKPLEGVKTALRVLDLLGVTLPEKPGQEDVKLGLQETASVLAGKPIAALVDLPPMQDPLHLAAMRILRRALPAVYQISFELMTLLASKMVNLSVNHGNAPESAAGYTNYAALVLCGMLGDFETGYQLGQLALSLVERYHVEELRARVGYDVNFFIRHWREHLRDTLAPYLEVYQSGLRTGDFLYGTYATALYGTNAFFAGKELSGLEQELAAYTQVVAQFKQEMSLMWHQLQRQVILNLMGRADGSAGSPPYCLRGAAGDEEVILAVSQQMQNIVVIFFVYFSKLILSYLFQAYPQAVENAAMVEKYAAVTTTTVYLPIFRFYDSLSHLAVYPESQEAEQARILEKVAASQEKMKAWAQLAPMNYLHKFYLVEAERARVLGHGGEAREYYDQAIALAQEHGYVNEEALAQELAGQFYLARGQEHLAQLYLHNAHYAYQLWGAAAKARDLEQRYPQWLASKPATKTHPLTDTSTDTQHGEAVDFATILKASQAISGEIVLEKLLTRLMEIAIENAGAETGLLLFEEGGVWVVKAEGGQTVRTFPASMINYVARTKEAMVLGNAAREGQFTRDSYILARQPKSVLCAPLINQGRLVGLLYLENNLAAGAFTPGRLEVLHLLSAQAAISIENATLYTTLEQKVTARTAELARATAWAEERSQAAEAANRAKSVFLANMSHELRTPLNAILGFSELMTRDPGLTGDQHENLKIIGRSGEHLLALINDVLEISKIEAGRAELQPQDFDLRWLLLGLGDMFRLRAEQKGLTLTLTIAPDVPQFIRADQGKLRQVLINLLGNAVKFTNAGGITLRVGRQYTVDSRQNAVDSRQNVSDTVPSLPSTDYRLLFAVQDTGVGIAPDELGHIFEPFVQSESGRRTPQGTGLGLSISREYVRLMGGDLSAHSEVDKGSCFEFALPLEVVSAAQGEDIGRRVMGLAPGQPAYKLLVVEDEVANRQLLVKLLQPLGFEVREATNGREAVDLWQTWQPHLIFMDMRLPVLDGRAATRQIRAMPQGQPTVIVALTASAFEEEREQILAQGCDDFVRKPFREATIFAVLARHLSAQFVYAELAAPEKPVVAVAPADLATAVANLPAALRQELGQAALIADMLRIAELTEEIRTHNVSLAETLAILANEFDYGKILALVSGQER